MTKENRERMRAFLWRERIKPYSIDKEDGFLFYQNEYKKYYITNKSKLQKLKTIHKDWYYKVEPHNVIYVPNITTYDNLDIYDKKYIFYYMLKEMDKLVDFVFDPSDLEFVVFDDFFKEEDVEVLKKRFNDDSLNFEDFKKWYNHLMIPFRR
ncbi:hypothetical protein [Mycoplasma procyoni]|uniref:hypothetical protein n=1 Tax=Mycoplasma procyoni TaxID=568784 RepID=UPI00197C9C0E|nr:hypothetical protein [Mycoplasma procyoni]MBN3534706.1 hypothetical protein [Mycoplasma procyoni]